LNRAARGRVWVEGLSIAIAIAIEMPPVGLDQLVIAGASFPGRDDQRGL
jgi:hypothetical protein